MPGASSDPPKTWLISPMQQNAALSPTGWSASTLPAPLPASAHGMVVLILQRQDGCKRRPSPYSPSANARLKPSNPATTGKYKPISPLPEATTKVAGLIRSLRKTRKSRKTAPNGSGTRRMPKPLPIVVPENPVRLKRRKSRPSRAYPCSTISPPFNAKPPLRRKTRSRSHRLFTSGTR